MQAPFTLTPLNKVQCNETLTLISCSLMEGCSRFRCDVTEQTPCGDVFCASVSAADTEDVCIVERLFSSSLVAIVSLKAPRKLKVCHFKKGTEICNYSYSNTILAVKLNRQVGEIKMTTRLVLFLSVLLMLPLSPCRGWLCVWKSRFTFTTSETWKCCTPSERLHPTRQVGSHKLD